MVHRFESSNSPGFPVIQTQKGYGAGRPKMPAATATSPSSARPGNSSLRPPAPAVPPVRPPALAPAAPVLMSSRRRVAFIRQKITDSDVTDIMIDFVAGRWDLTSDQVAAGMALLNKIVPDLAKLDLEDEDTEEDASTEFEVCIVDPQA